MIWGGLVTKWLWPLLATSLIANGSFNQRNNNWQLNPNRGAWSIVSTAQDGDGSALSIRNGNTQSITPSAAQGVTLASGLYSLDGWIKTVHVTNGGGGRFQLQDTSSNQVGKTVTMTGTKNWSESTNRMFQVINSGTYLVLCSANGKPNGQVIFDNLKFQQLKPPDVESFLLHPNYMGQVWDDGDNSATISYRGTAGASGALVLSVDGSGAAITQIPVTVQNSWQSATFDLSSLSDGAYDIQFAVPGANYSPTYKVVKAPRPANGYIDENGYLELPNAQGVITKRFAIGVYDTGNAHSTAVANWAAYFANYFPQIQADLYLNYELNGSPYGLFLNMGTALRQLGMAYIDTVNADYFPTWPNLTPTGVVDTATVKARGQAENNQPGIFGWYEADERDLNWTNVTWQQRLLYRQNAPSMPSFIANRIPQDLNLWRDITDIIGVDPYPVYFGQPLETVSQWTQQAIAAGQYSRPVWTVVQFWGSSDGVTRWPTQSQLRSETWLAICSGANGVFYWSLGTYGLATVTSETQQTILLNELAQTVSEVKGYESQLTAAPGTLPRLPTGVIGIARLVGSTTYVFTINATSSPIVDSGNSRSWQPYDTQFWTM